MTEAVDLTNPDEFVQGFPHEYFAELRRTDPVHWFEEPDGNGFWVITKHTDVGQLSRDYWHNSSELGGVMLLEPTPEMLEQNRQMMLMMDPPRHTKLRLLVNRGFTPKHITMLEQHVRDLAGTIVDTMLEKGECDFVTEVAAELPLQVIAEMMGVPHEERHKMFEWSNRMVGSDDPEYAVSAEDTANASIELFMYANDLAAKKRKAPADDIITALLQAEVDGERLSDLEFDLFFMLLAVAGNETTRNLLSHAMAALFENPDQWQDLLEHPELLPNAVEEFLRWGTPVMYFRRTATGGGFTLRDKQIRDGDRVTMWYQSANRDEEVFTDPHSFDIRRSPNNHIAFGGGGPHYCLGHNLARLEIRVMFEELLRRAPRITQTGPVSRLRSNFIYGIKHLPVRVSA